MFPQVAPKFFAQRADGPRNVGKDPQAAAAPAAGAAAGDSKAKNGKAPLTGRVAYNVKVGGTTHQVVVEPA
jgi:methylmalonyl-CoA carboxyltransferase 5S subunit